MNREHENAILYFYNELDEAQRRKFEAHLSACAACSAELVFLRRAQEALTAPAAPAAVVEKLFAKTTRRPSFWAGWKPVLACAAAVCVAVIVFVAGQQPQPFEQNQSVLAYVSNAFDEDYENFAVDLEVFEEDF